MLHLPASAHSLSVGGSMRDDCRSTNAPPTGAKLPVWDPAPALNCLRSPAKLTCQNCCSSTLPSFDCIENKPGRGINAQDIADLKISLGQLPLQPGGSRTGIGLVVAVEIDMVMPVAPVCQHDGAAVHGDVVAFVEELFIDQLQHRMGLPGDGVGKVEIAMLVIAGQRLDP